MTVERNILMEIHRAIKKGDLKFVIQLMEEDPARLHWDTPFGTWLQDAASYGQVEIAKWLISKGLDVNAFSELVEVRPIDRAAAEGSVEMVKLLIDSGASLDVSESVRNPLLAVIVGDRSESSITVAKLLIESGLDIDVVYPNLGNEDALDRALLWGRSDIADLIREHRKKKQ